MIIEIIEIWHSAHFREALLKDPTSERPWKTDNGGGIIRVQLPTDWSEEEDYGYAQEAS